MVQFGKSVYCVSSCCTFCCIIWFGNRPMMFGLALHSVLWILLVVWQLCCFVTARCTFCRPPGCRRRGSWGQFAGHVPCLNDKICKKTSAPIEARQCNIPSFFGSYDRPADRRGGARRVGQTNQQTDMRVHR